MDEQILGQRFDMIVSKVDAREVFRPLKGIFSESDNVVILKVDFVKNEAF